MKRILSGLFVAAVTLGLLAGCTTTPAATAPVTLKIGQLPIIDGLPFWVAESKKYYDEFGVNIELVTFRSAQERDTALSGGQIDGVLTDLVSSTILVAGGTKVKIVSIGLGVTKEEGPMGIVAAPNSGITTVEQLKGVEVSISTNSVIHYVQEMLLIDAGFKADEIKTSTIASIPLRFEALMSNQIKAALLPDPLLSLAIAQGARLIVSDANAQQNYSQSVIVFTEQAINEKAAGVERFFKAYNRAVGDIKANPDSFKQVLVEKASLPAAIKDSYKVVPFSPAQAPKKEDVERVAKWLLDKQVIKTQVTYDDLVTNKSLLK